MTAVADRKIRDKASRRWRELQAAAVVYALGTAIHSVDHLRRGPDSVTSEVKELGAIFTLAAALVVALIFTKHRFAPLFAVLIGFSHGIGIMAVHWLPHWSAASDALLTSGASPFSWVAVALEVAGAFAVGSVGLMMLADWSRGPRLAWLIGLVAVLTVVPLGIGAIAGEDVEVVRVASCALAVFGALYLASRLAPREWIAAG